MHREPVLPILHIECAVAIHATQQVISLVLRNINKGYISLPKLL